jgi:hypothetical protein
MGKTALVNIDNRSPCLFIALDFLTKGFSLHRIRFGMLQCFF